MITGAGVVARKLTFSNSISELLDGAPPAPRWLFRYITVTSHAAGLSRTVIVRAVSRSHRPGDTVQQPGGEPDMQQVSSVQLFVDDQIQNVLTTSKM